MLRKVDNDKIIKLGKSVKVVKMHFVPLKGPLDASYWDKLIGNMFVCIALFLIDL